MTNLIDLQAQIQALQSQAAALREKEFDATVKEIKAKMAAFSITVKDLQASSAKKRGRVKGANQKAENKTKKVGARAKVAAKYSGPNGESWSGRGLTPKWLSALMATGRAKDEFLVAAKVTSSI